MSDTAYGQAMHHINDHVRFTATPPFQDRLNFAEPTVPAIAAWIQALPMANLGKASQALYHGLSELNQLVLNAPARLELLEQLRPAVYHLNQLLARYYLDQPTQLPPKALESARLSQALQAMLYQGYNLVRTETDAPAAASSKKLAPHFALLHQRCVAELGQLFLRSCRLYAPHPKGLWTELHSHYLAAAATRCEELAVKDPQLLRRSEISVRDQYLAVLLLDAAKPPQLRQQDFSSLYNALEEWAAYASIEPADTAGRHGYYQLQFDVDLGPQYQFRTTFPASVEVHALDLSALTARVQDPQEDVAASVDWLHDTLRAQLIEAWGERKRRVLSRVECNDRVSVCVGLPSIHYHISGSLDFDQWLAADPNGPASTGEENPFTRSLRLEDRYGDVWNLAADARGTGARDAQSFVSEIQFDRALMADQGRKTNLTHAVEVIDASPDGYCLEWTTPMPERIQAGELLAIRVNDHLPWSVAVVRWLSLLEDNQLRTGVELLGSAARSSAIWLQRKLGGESTPMRALLLPGVRAKRKASSLITFSHPFTVGNKVVFREGLERRSAVLVQCIASNTNFAQYEYRTLSTANTPESTLPEASETNPDRFEQLWKIL